MLAISSERLEELEEVLSRKMFSSQSISEIPTALRRRGMMCFISCKRNYFTHVARSVVFHESESGRHKLDIWNIIAFSKPVRILAIKAKLSGPQSWRARKALDGGHISAGAFKLVLDALRRVDAKAFAAADGLTDRRRQPPDPTSTRAKINYAYQRDASLTALEIARIPRERLRIRPQISEDAAADLTSIFDSDSDFVTVEDILVLKDLDDAGEEWKQFKSQLYPAKSFKNGDTKLTIILANKLPLEHQLGTDLIYVNETLKSVTFVQYKMFKGLDGEGGYRPDAQLGEEIARMDAALATINGVATDETCDGYRFSFDPFFFKFCKKLLTYDENGHVPGIYIPLSYWKRFTETPTVKGKRGGKVIYKETFGRRYFTPTHFIDMVGRGWIGTNTLQTDLLIPYLKSMIEGKKGIVLAVENLIVSDDKGLDEDGHDTSYRTMSPPKSRYPRKKRRIIQM